MISRCTVLSVGVEALDRWAQEADRGGGFLVGDCVDVDQTGDVVDGDVDAFPLDDVAYGALGIGALAGVAAAVPVGDSARRGRGGCVRVS
jgi:hypothetical protein